MSNAPIVPVSAVTGAFFGFYNYKLAWDVIKLRRSNKVSLGSGGNDNLERAIRAHGNFSEYSPIMLFEVLLLELNGAPRWLVAALAAVMSLGRVSHSLGIVQPSPSAFRRNGMAITFASLLSGAIANVYYARSLFMK